MEGILSAALELTSTDHDSLVLARPVWREDLDLVIIWLNRILRDLLVPDMLWQDC
jgi:hypothetical protein